MGNILALSQILIGLLDRASAITALFKKAHSEGRDITEAELDALASADDAASLVLRAEIAKARAAGG